jgi:APA family basic amino acid/polyamine antiporter
VGSPEVSARSAPHDPAPGLLRQLGLFSAIALVVSNMIGTGIFGALGFQAGDLGDPWIILLIWVVGAVCALAGAFCFSELGVNFPSSGGEYVYLTRAFGPTWGFMTGWVSFFAGFSAPVAFSALAFSDYLGYFWPALKQANAPITLGGGSFAIKVGGAQLCASALILTFTIINFFGVKRVAALQNVLTTTKVLVIVTFILLGLVAGAGDWSHFSQPATRWTTTPLAAQFAIALFWVYVGYSGWNAATYVAEEIRQPTRTLPLALAAGTGIVAVVYLLLNVVFIYSTPLEKMKGQIAVGSIAALNLFGPAVAGIFSALMALSLVSTVNAMVTIGPRVYYAMAKNGAFLQAAAHVNERWHTPVFAITCQGIVAMLMTFTPFPSLATYIGVLLNFFASVSVASLFVLRKRPGWIKLPVVSFAFPLFPMIFILVGAWMTLFGVTLEPKISGAAAATIATGALVYHFRIKGREVR